jgi:hypothetical protein
MGCHCRYISYEHQPFHSSSRNLWYTRRKLFLHPVYSFPPIDMVIRTGIRFQSSTSPIPTNVLYFCHPSFSPYRVAQDSIYVPGSRVRDTRILHTYMIIAYLGSQVSSGPVPSLPSRSLLYTNLQVSRSFRLLLLPSLEDRQAVSSDDRNYACLYDFHVFIYQLLVLVMTGW